MYVVEIAITSNATIMLNESDRDKIVYLTNFKIQATIQTYTSAYEVASARVILYNQM